MATLNVGIPDEVQAIIDKGKPYIVPTDVAAVIHISDATVRARAKAGMLEFPCMVARTRVRIPTVPFLRWLGYDVIT